MIEDVAIFKETFVTTSTLQGLFPLSFAVCIKNALQSEDNSSCCTPAKLLELFIM